MSCRLVFLYSRSVCFLSPTSFPVLFIFRSPPSDGSLEGSLIPYSDYRGRGCHLPGYFLFGVFSLYSVLLFPMAVLKGVLFPTRITGAKAVISQVFLYLFSLFTSFFPFCFASLPLFLHFLSQFCTAPCRFLSFLGLTQFPG